jgi:hypothetical protein
LSAVKSTYLPLLNPNVVKWLVNVALVFETGQILLNVACAYNSTSLLKVTTFSKDDEPRPTSKAIPSYN